MATKKASKPATKPVAPPAAQAPAPKGEEMAVTPLTVGFLVSPAVNSPESEAFLLSPSTQAPLSDITDVTVSEIGPMSPIGPMAPVTESATAPFVAFLTQSEHTSSLEDGQGLIQTTAEAETTLPLPVALPAAYSTHAGAPKKQAGTYYTPQPPRLR